MRACTCVHIIILYVCVRAHTRHIRVTLLVVIKSYFWSCHGPHTVLRPRSAAPPSRSRVSKTRRKTYDAHPRESCNVCRSPFNLEPSHVRSRNAYMLNDRAAKTKRKVELYESKLFHVPHEEHTRSRERWTKRTSESLRKTLPPRLHRRENTMEINLYWSCRSEEYNVNYFDGRARKTNQLADIKLLRVFPVSRRLCIKYLSKHRRVYRLDF